MTGPQRPNSGRQSYRLEVGRSGFTVLLALSDPVERRGLAEFLGSAGCHVVAVENDRLALEETAQRGFGAAVADLYTLEVKGVALAGKLAESAPDTEVILVVSAAAAGRREKCERLGVLDVLERPFDAAELLALIKQSEGGSRSRRLAAAERGRSEPRPGERSRRMLVVDDNPDLCAMVVELLAGKGLEVSGATSLPAALERLAGEDFDLVITDLDLDGQKGAEAVRLLRQAGPDAMIVAMSGSGDLADAARAAGAHAFLAKPFGMNELRAAVAQAGSGGASRRGRGRGSKPPAAGAKDILASLARRARDLIGMLGLTLGSPWL